MKNSEATISLTEKQTRALIRVRCAAAGGPVPYAEEIGVRRQTVNSVTSYGVPISAAVAKAAIDADRELVYKVKKASIKKCGICRKLETDLIDDDRARIITLEQPWSDKNEKSWLCEECKIELMSGWAKEPNRTRTSA